jgi:hypothetical protein
MAIRLRTKLGLSAISVLFTLAFAEGAAAVRARGAFPYLNLFRRDPRFGVVLEPLSRARLRSKRGRISEVITSARGFRGAEWSPAGEGRILLLGDSQIFGYGVDASEAIAARLAARTGSEVLNAAVPTWGPIEYALAAEDLVPEQRPELVVFTVNAANDWMESNVPNLMRSDAADGWLMRKRRDAPERTAFPGREWLLGRSQLVFAVRQLRGLSALDGNDLSLGASAAGRVLDQLAELDTPRGEDRSRITVHLRRVIGVCRVHGCRVIAAVLPMDVQVDGREWAKYGTAPTDLGPTLILAERFLFEASSLGARTVDLLEPLRRGSPGAFLDDDPHLSPRGHEIIAEAIARALEAGNGGRS